MRNVYTVRNESRRLTSFGRRQRRRGQEQRGQQGHCGAAVTRMAGLQTDSKSQVRLIRKNCYEAATN